VRTRLSFKILAAFLLTFFVVLALMIVSIRFLAYQNFSDYVHKVEIEMLDQFVDRLSAEYQKHHGWKAVRGHPLFWYRILHWGSGASPVTKMEAGNDRKGSPPADLLKTDPNERRYLMRMVHRLSLFDRLKSPIAGPARSIKGHALRRINVDGKTVGWLGLRKEERLSHPLDVAFLKEQSKAFYLVGVGVLVLAAIVSYFLSRHLLAPIKQLTAGTRALTSFKFETRIDVHTKDELGQLASDFNVMAKTLEKSEEMRQQWITDISHELRTPLSILRGEIEALQDGVRDLNRQSLDSLHSEVIYLSKIVRDLHDLSLAETGALPFNKEPVNPIQVLRETLNLFKTRFAQHQITVLDEMGADQNLAIRGDTDRLTQLFSNLLENALRYTDRPGTLRIWQNLRGNRLVLYFEDSGPGVPEASVDRLFDRLYRVDPARTRAGGGSGLGLSICKKIVEAHGAKIEAANAPSGGLRFIIDFPLSLS
jgi:two-component system sensor histidine kinase BaeS